MGRHRYMVPEIDNVEDVEHYQKWGYCPTNLGDRYRGVLGTYRVIHKLGQGGFSIVWLVRNENIGRNFALKVLRGNAPQKEIDLLRKLQANYRQQLPKMRIPWLHEVISIPAPYTNEYGNPLYHHQALVLDVVGPSLRQLDSPTIQNGILVMPPQPPLYFLKSAAQQLSESIAEFHSVGLSHGDLTRSNVLFELPALQTWTEDEVKRYLGEPVTDPLLNMDGSNAGSKYAPSNVVSAISFPPFHLDGASLSGKIRVSDLGEAFFCNKIPAALGTNVSFFAPEMYFGNPQPYLADLWALGCLIFEMHAFQLFIPAVFGAPGEAISWAHKAIGPLPWNWRTLYDPQRILQPEYFGPSPDPDKSLESRLGKIQLSQQERIALIQLLKSILVFDPHLRVPAAQLPRHSYFFT